jgi:hypothetical protein
VRIRTTRPSPWGSHQRLMLSTLSALSFSEARLGFISAENADPVTTMPAPFRVFGPPLPLLPRSPTQPPTPRCLCPVFHSRVLQPKRASWSAPDPPFPHPPFPPHPILLLLSMPSSVFTSVGHHVISQDRHRGLSRPSLLCECPACDLGRHLGVR